MIGEPPVGVSRRVIAIVFPSVDHDSGEGEGQGGCAIGRLHAPFVTRRDLPLIGSTIQMCDGVGAVVVRKSSSPISNERLFLSSFGSGSSAVTYAICVPSGFQANCCTPRGASVMRRASPPDVGISQSCRF